MIKDLSEQISSFGLCAPRCYYVPFGAGQEEAERERSERFVSLDGTWKFRAYGKLSDIGEDFCTQTLPDEIPVPSCVQYFGYDGFQYTNVRYPFPYDPPRVPVKNPAFHYSRLFEADGQGRLYLVFEGVDSCFYVYINGRFAGFSEISHRLSEFDVTGFVRPGQNRLDVVVQKWCTGSYFEDQDKWRFTGIFRDVYLLKRPEGHIVDYKIDTLPGDGEAEVIFSHRGGGEASVSFGGESKKVRAGESVRFRVRGPVLWSAETPVLYPLTIDCAGERIFEQVGICSAEIREGKFLFNGKPIKFRGVNRHDFHPEKGAAVSLGDMENDLILMKRLNVNAIRTSHYPSAPEFYKLCDRYGFYVISESDVETHGTTSPGAAPAGTSFVRTFGLLSDDRKYRDTYVERQRANVEVNKNRPSVAFWSMGNESGWGQNFALAREEIRSADSRPIHYESAIWVERPEQDEEYYTSTDIVSRMYPSVEWMKEGYLGDPKETRPLFLCEYAHAMGNGPGGFAEYWELMESDDRFMGGCVWEWADHGVSYRGQPFRYGGDFGEILHDGNFCIDGIVTADRKIKSGTLEMKKVYQPVVFSRTEGGMSAFNRNYFAPLAGKIRLVYKEYGKETGSEEISVAIAPRESVEVACRDAQTVLAYFLTAEEMPGLPAGSEIAFEGFFREGFLPSEVCKKAEISRREGNIFVHTPSADYEFDGTSGEIAVTRAGKALGSIRPVIWRAPTDNDTDVERWLRDAVNEAWDIFSDDCSVTVTGKFGFASRRPPLYYILCYTFGEEGFDVTADYRTTVPFVPRFGLCMKLSSSFDSLRYCAYGPGESYVDKHLGACKDVFSGKVSAEYSHLYIRPQESGSHFGADFAEVSDGSTTVRAEGMQSFSAVGYSAEVLTDTKHDDELPPADGTYFTADFAMRGIGSHSCGPELPARYRVPEKGKGKIGFRFLSVRK